MPATLRQKPAVWVMGSPRQFSGDHVRGDHLAVGALAAHHALAQGHRCCAYLGTEVNTLSYQVGLRGSAFQWQVTEAGGSVLMLVQRDLNIVTAGLNAPNEPLLGQLLDQMLAARPRPTLLMLQADMFAPSVYRHLAERGIRPQRDLAIITCNNERPYLVSLQPAPTVVDLQAQAIGRRAVEQLLWRRDHPDEPPCQVLVQPRLLTSDPTPQ
jgi:LacI family transcriptional regulator